MNTITKRRCAVGALAVVLCSLHSVGAQPISLGVQQTNGKLSVTWPAGLSLVQPQKRTNLVLGAWQDFGAATTVSNLTEVPGPGTAYYRLRFLAPTIAAEPQSQTNVTGSDVTFTVTATGTAPLAYQWQKASTNLIGKTATSLSLSNLVAGDAANYRVIITNRAGGTTSAVAVLTVTNPLVRPAGIYMGEFAGPADAGGFGVLLRSNALAYVVGYNTAQDEGVSASGFAVAVDGTFFTLTDHAGKISGTFTANAVSGAFTNSLGASGTYSGTRKVDAGIHAADAGYYVGNFTNLVYSIVGTARAVLAADGTVFFYSNDVTGDGGGYGTINSGNAVSAITVPDGYTVGGTLNTTSKVISGSYKSGATTVGTYSITRTLTP